MDVCVTYNQTIAKKYWLKKHIKEKHTKQLGNYCGKMFKKRMELNSHMDIVFE